MKVAALANLNPAFRGALDRLLFCISREHYLALNYDGPSTHAMSSSGTRLDHLPAGITLGAVLLKWLKGTYHSLYTSGLGDPNALTPRRTAVYRHVAFRPRPHVWIRPAGQPDHSGARVYVLNCNPGSGILPRRDRDGLQRRYRDQGDALLE